MAMMSVPNNLNEVKIMLKSFAIDSMQDGTDECVSSRYSPASVCKQYLEC